MRKYKKLIATFIFYLMGVLIIGMSMGISAYAEGEGEKADPGFTVRTEHQYPLRDKQHHFIKVENVPEDVVLHFESKNPEVLTFPDDTDPNYEWHGPGWAVVTVTSDETDKYYSVTQTSRVYLYKYAQNIRGPYSIEKPFSDGGYQMNTYTWHIYTDYEVTSSNESIATVTKEGYITFLKPGTVYITVRAYETDLYQEGKYTVPVRITDDRQSQTISGPSTLEIEYGKAASLGMSAEMPLSYSSSNNAIATVDNRGIITFKKAGTVTVTVNAGESDKYKPAVKRVTVTARDYKAEAAAAEAKKKAEAAAAKKAADAKAAEIQKTKDKAAADKLAKSLKKPKLKCRRGKRKNKLSWKKVKGASGYELYVKYPGQNNFELAVTKGAKIKSVTHKGLTKKKKYKYKLRAYVQVGTVRSYGPFSKTLTAKVR